MEVAVFSTVGNWLNRQNLRFTIEHRPDFHAKFGGIPDYSKLTADWTFKNKFNNCGDLARFHAIYLNVNQVLADGVPGDFVELGIYKGNSAKLLATLGRRHNRWLNLFDTFSGFDTRDLRGVDSDQNVQFQDTSLTAVREFVGTEGVTYIAGFLPQSIAGVALPQRIAVAHIDCDLYEPMKRGLEVFYPRLSIAGILLLHDYSSGLFPGSKRAIDEFFEKRPEKPALWADKSGTALVRRAG